MDSSKRINVRDVRFTFEPTNKPPVLALDRLNVTVEPGEFVCVVGASGSGKSTLLRLLHGLLRPDKGQIEFGERPVSGPSRDRAMVFQSDNLLPWKTVVDNVAYGLRIAGVSKLHARESALERLKAVGLEGAAEQYPRQLSGGMRQRVNIARAFAVDPQVLLLDEPFAALDAQTREILSSELLSLWAKDRKTVVFITHQIDEAVYLADRVVVLSAHPGTVREIVPVSFDRPRELAIKRTSEFGAIVDHIWSLIEDEVRRSLRISSN